MQLVLCNTQSELHPLEEGKHAAESGLDLKAYAVEAGKAETTLATKRRAYFVYVKTHVSFDQPQPFGDGVIYRPSGIDITQARDSWRNLAEIHAAPEWLWSALVKQMIGGEWTVATTRQMVGLDQKGRASLKKDMAEDYSRSERYIRETTSRIDKDLKAELRETAFQMWMACYDNQEIADTIGFSRPAVSEFVNLLQNVRNSTDGDTDVSSENPELAETREFDEDDEPETNGLGVYKLDKRCSACCAGTWVATVSSQLETFNSDGLQCMLRRNMG